jgi:hypothetical protein
MTSDSPSTAVAFHGASFASLWSVSKLEWVSLLASAVMLLATATAIPWAVKRLPVDYFIRPAPRHSLAMMIVRNVVGSALIVLGALMLVLPGQGILTILVGLVLVDFPIKHRILMKLLCRPTVARGLDLLRKKLGRPPFILPDRKTSPSRRARVTPFHARGGRYGTP